jgi:hypothetical protein
MREMHSPSQPAETVARWKTNLSSSPVMAPANLAQPASFVELGLTYILCTFTIYPSLAKLMMAGGSP